MKSLKRLNGGTAGEESIGAHGYVTIHDEYLSRLSPRNDSYTDENDPNVLLPRGGDIVPYMSEMPAGTAGENGDEEFKLATSRISAQQAANDAAVTAERMAAARVQSQVESFKGLYDIFRSMDKNYAAKRKMLDVMTQEVEINLTTGTLTKFGKIWDMLYVDLDEEEIESKRNARINGYMMLQDCYEGKRMYCKAMKAQLRKMLHAKSTLGAWYGYVSSHTDVPADTGILANKTFTFAAVPGLNDTDDTPSENTYKANSDDKWYSMSDGTIVKLISTRNSSDMYANLKCTPLVRYPDYETALASNTEPIAEEIRMWDKLGADDQFKSKAGVEHKAGQEANIPESDDGLLSHPESTTDTMRHFTTKVAIERISGFASLGDNFIGKMEYCDDMLRQSEDNPTMCDEERTMWRRLKADSAILYKQRKAQIEASLEQKGQ